MSQLVVFHTGDAPKDVASFGVRVLDIGQSQHYSFPVGPVAAKLVYAEHPLDDDVLLPFGSFDEVIAEDKFREALRIMTILGASELTSQVINGSAKDGTLEAGVGGARIRGRVGKTQRNQTEFHEVGSGGQPADPEPLRWPREPGFEAARIAVLRNGAREITIKIEKTHTLSVESDLATALKKLGLSLGASFESRRSYVYVLNAKFPGTTGQPPAPPPFEAAPSSVTTESPPPPKRKGLFR